MSNSKYAEIARILQKYDFKMETEIDIDLTCVICHKILKNAHNGHCGCRYCFCCIIDYISNGEIFCPGKFEECKDQRLKLNENVLIDQAANIKISRLIIKCPEIDCKFEDELKNFSEHIRVCDVKTRNCPYFDFGCMHANIPYNKMNEHLSNESYNHTTLMLDVIQNLKNEVESYKPIKSELEAVKQELQTNKIAMIEMQEKMNLLVIEQKTSIALDKLYSDESVISSGFSFSDPFEGKGSRGCRRPFHGRGHGHRHPHPHWMDNNEHNFY